MKNLSDLKIMSNTFNDLFLMDLSFKVGAALVTVQDFKGFDCGNPFNDVYALNGRIYFRHGKMSQFDAIHEVCHFIVAKVKEDGSHLLENYGL